MVMEFSVEKADFFMIFAKPVCRGRILASQPVVIGHDLPALCVFTNEGMNERNAHSARVGAVDLSHDFGR